MRALRTAMTPRQGLAAAGLFVVSAALAAPANAAAPRYADTLPLSRVHAGMTGYGLTTFRGTTVSRFGVRVLGILKRANFGHDLIVVRLFGGPITKRSANLIEGMSGSPIYLNGKVAGAFSMGEEFPREPIGMVTPIDDMLDAWNPDIPQRPMYFQPAMRPHTIALSEPIRLDGRTVRTVVLASATTPLRSTPGCAVLRPAATQLAVTGAPPRLRRWFSSELDRLGYAAHVSDAPATGSTHAGLPPLRPGAPFGALLVSGDMEVGAFGTVTYRKGGRILGFGHPLFTLGAVDASLTSASIIDVMSGLRTSHLIAQAGPEVGSLVQDRNFSVSGAVGTQPTMAPVTIEVRDATEGRSQTFHCRVFRHPQLTALLLKLVASDAIDQVHPVPGDAMAHVTTNLQVPDLGTVARSSTVFDSVDLGLAATADLDEIAGLVSANPWYPLPIDGVHIMVDITAGHQTATIERIFLPGGRFKPGDDVPVSVKLKPYRAASVIQTVHIRVPTDATSGRYPITIRGGASGAMRIGGFTVAAPGGPDAEAPPINVRQMLERVERREASTDLVARLTLAAPVPAVGGQLLGGLPPNLAALMRADRDSGIVLQREEVRTTMHTPWVVSGMQQLLLTVIRPEEREARAGTPSPVGSVLQPAGLPGAELGTPVRSPLSTDDNAGDDLVQVGNVRSMWLDAVGGVAPPRKRPAPATGPPAQPAVPGPAAAAASTAPQPEPVAKPVGRGVQTWRQAGSRDFSSGVMHGLDAGSDGALHVAPEVTRLASTGENYVWAVEPDTSGGWWAGTGPHGKLFHIDSAGKVLASFTIPAVSVQSLTVAPDGAVYAGTVSPGQVWRVLPGGAPSLLCTLSDPYVVGLAADARGHIYAAAGSGGTVYRITLPTSAGATPRVEPWMATPADHIICLAANAAGTVVAGTANSGVVYGRDAGGQTRVVFDAGESAVTAIAIEPSGTVFAGTGPTGALYRVMPDGTSGPAIASVSSFFTGLAVSPAGSVLATTVTSAYEVDSPDSARPLVRALDTPPGIDFLTVSASRGGVAFGTGSLGDVYTAAPQRTAAASYDSVVHDAGAVAQWGAVRWEPASAPATGIVVETRTGNGGDPDATWGPWLAAVHRSTPGEATVASKPGRFIQFRIVAPAGAASSVAIRAVAVDYLPATTAPQISIQTPSGGERWSGKQALKWAVTGGDTGPLHYAVAYENLAAPGWRPLPADGSASGAAAQTKPSTLLDAKGQVTDPVRQAILDDIRKAAAPGAQTGSPEATQRAFDSATLADGVYRIRVTASEAGDPGTELAEAVSEPFVIANGDPAIAIPATVTAGMGMAVIEGRASQAYADITAVQFRVDGGEWLPAQAVDGLFDAPDVRFSLHLPKLAKGAHSVEIQAFSSSGRHATTKVSVTSP